MDKFDDWELKLSDNHVWLDIGNTSHNLGPLDQALDKLAAFLAANDYEERVSSALSETE